MAITTYTDISDAGKIAGALNYTIQNGSLLTGLNIDTVVLPAGFGCVYGTGGVELPSGAGSFAGIITLPNTIEKRDSYSLDSGDRFGYPVDYEVAFATTDCWWVYVDDTVAIGDAVYLNHTASSSVVGTFRNDANSTNAQLISGAQFVTAATGTDSSLAIAAIAFKAS